MLKTIKTGMDYITFIYTTDICHCLPANDNALSAEKFNEIKAEIMESIHD